MDTEKIVENAFSITPKDIFQNRVYPGISYWVDESREGSFVFICADGHEPEKFELEYVEITFGTRAYFRCKCNSRINKLYLPENSHSFGCRRCNRLQYFLTSINKNSIAGRKLYRMNRLQKLSESRENMKKILHNGKFSKRFESYLKQCDRAGFKTIVQGAEELKALIAG